MAQNPTMLGLLEGAQRHEKRSLARLVSQFELAGSAGEEARAELLSLLEQRPDLGQANGIVVGFTGTPGAGKSTLINVVAQQVLTEQPDASVAVVAVDPTSQLSGGSLLGDRTRTRFPSDEKRLYFRSQPTNLELGGITLKTFQAVRILRRFFSVVIVETVGIGQSELAVGDLAEQVYLVLQPLGGDQVQFLKSGIMELPDHFIVNKCDASAVADETVNMLKAGLKTANVISPRSVDRQVFRTSAINEQGTDELTAHILNQAQQDADFADTEQRLFQRWMHDQYGQVGSNAYLASVGGVEQGNASLESRQGHCRCWFSEKLQ